MKSLETNQNPVMTWKAENFEITKELLIFCRNNKGCVVLVSSQKKHQISILKSVSINFFFIDDKIPESLKNSKNILNPVYLNCYGFFSKKKDI